MNVWRPHFVKKVKIVVPYWSVGCPPPNHAALGHKTEMFYCPEKPTFYTETQKTEGRGDRTRKERKMRITYCTLDYNPKS
jgi:hypothetical protein